MPGEKVFEPGLEPMYSTCIRREQGDNRSAGPKHETEMSKGWRLFNAYSAGGHHCTGRLAISGSPTLRRETVEGRSRQQAGSKPRRL